MRDRSREHARIVVTLPIRHQSESRYNKPKERAKPKFDAPPPGLGQLSRYRFLLLLFNIDFVAEGVFDRLFVVGET